MDEEQRRTRQRAAYLWRTYGLTPVEYDSMARRGCQVCGNPPKPGRRLHVDHEHVRGFKRMTPAEKREYVRGVVCWKCNSILLRRGVTPDNLRGAARYLDRYARRRMKSHG